MASISWYTPVSGDWTAAGDWNTGAVPGAGDSAVIGFGGSYTVSLTTSITVGSIAISDPGATLAVANPGGTETITAGLANNGALELDTAGGGGGSSLTVGGVLTNRNYLQIGPNNGDLTANTTVTAAGLVNTGTIQLDGGEGNPGASQAILDITAAAPGTLTGTVELYGNSLLEFASGHISTIAGTLYLYGTGAGSAQQSFVADANNTTSNSALTGLTSNLGTFWLRGSASVTTSAAFTNSGDLELDRDGGYGGSSLTIGGALTNTNYIRIGADNNDLTATTTVTAKVLANTGTIVLDGGEDNPGTSQAVLDITGGAPGTLTGTVELYGNSLLEFGSGEISTIAGTLYLYGTGSGSAQQSFVADASNTTKNSALTGLTSNLGTFFLRGGASVTTSAAFTNSGDLELDRDGGYGGSSLTIGGALTNTNYIRIGADNNDLRATTTVTAKVLANTGTIVLDGGEDNPGTSQAVLDITGGAPGILNGTIELYGNSLLEFGSGEISTIAGTLFLYGTGAGSAQQSFVADAGNTTKNSALTGLTSNLGTFWLRGGASVATSAAFTNSGDLELDRDGGYGGSSLTIGGVLTNTNYIRIGADNNDLRATTTVTAKGLANTGTIVLDGGGGNPGTSQALLTINGAAVNDGTISLVDNSEIDVTGSNAFSQNAGVTTVGGVLVASTITVNGGLLDFTAPLSSGDGTGGIAIGANGTVEFGAGVAAGHTATFTASTGTLELATPATVAATIAGFSGGDVIDLLNSTVTSLIYSGSSTSGTLTVSNAGVTIATLLFSGNYGTASFTSASDGHGGTDIILTQPNAVVQWSNASGGSWTTGTNWVGDNAPGSSNDAEIAVGGGYTVSLTSAITVNSVAITDTVATLSIAAPGETETITTNLVNGGAVDVDTSGGAGGTTVSVGGELANGGNLYIGNGGLDATTTVSAASLSNTGGINLTGNSNGAADQAVLDIAGAAGFGAAGIVTGTVQLYGDALLEFSSGGITTIALGAQLNIQTGIGYVADKSSQTSNSALAGLTSNLGYFDLSFGATVATSAGTAFTNIGTANLDDYAGSPGGSSFSIGGALINIGMMNIGGDAISKATSVSATGLHNTGTINLQGNNSGGTEGILDISAAAGFGTAGVVTGTVNLYGDALLEFASGTVTTIAAGAQLNIQTGIGYVADTGGLTSNSALTGLTSNLGYFDLSFGATVATTAGTAFTNIGTVNLDDYAGSPGGSSFSIGGALINIGMMNIGGDAISKATSVSATGLHNTGTINLQGNNSGGALATLSISAAAGFGTAGVVTGTVNLDGDALLEFSSGGITTIAPGATLNIQTGIGYVADKSSLTSDSALTGLTSNAGNFDLSFGATVATSAGTAFTNIGTVNLDDYAGSPGGSSFSIGGALTNIGTMNIGSGDISQATSVSATALTNSGTINLQGNNSGGAEAVLDISAAAGFGTAGVVTGTVNLYGDALLEFSSGGITTIASGAQLNIQTGIGYVADKSSQTSNSALTGLTSNLDNFDLSYGATVATSAGTAFTNGGTVNIDNYGGSPGGSSFSIGGVLTNSGTMDIGSGGISQATSVSAAGLSNGGTINLQGNNNGGTLATLSIAATAGFGTDGVVYGTVNLYGDALLQFASGGITTIASGAQLNIQTGIGYVADLGSITSNSALTELTGNAGNFDLSYGATVTTTAGADFTNSGTVDIDDYAGSPGGSSFNIGGTLINGGTMYIGANGQSTPTTVSASGLSNSGTIDLYGNTTANGRLSISGTGSNTGAVNISLSTVLDDSATYDQVAGTTTVSGTLDAAEVEVLGGLLQGTGTVGGPVDNSGGTVLAGVNSTAGTLTVNGAYSQGAGGTLEALLNGTTAFSTLATTQATITGGTLDAQVNFTLAAGDSFEVMSFAAGTFPGLFGSLAVNGTAGSSTFVDLSGSLTLGVNYNIAAGQIDLAVFATPSSHSDIWAGGTGTWTTAADWSAGTPNAGSDVTIGNTGSGNVTLNETDTIDSLTIDSGNGLSFAADEALVVGGDLTILSGGTLTMTSAGDILAIGGSDSDAGKMTIGSGDEFDLAGNLTVSGGLVLNGGTIGGPGTLTIAAGGTVSGTGTLDVALVNDGSILSTGVLIDADSVANSGSISGGMTVAGGGYLYNALGGRITKAGTALTGISGAAGATITNFGTIEGTGTAGVGVVFSGAGGSTLTNAGLILGATTAVSFGSTGSNRLILDPGEAFTGKVVGAAGSNLIELSGTTASDLAGLGTSFVGFKGVTVDAGAYWQLTGANTIASGEGVTGAGSLSDSGPLINDGSIGLSLTLTGSGSVTNSDTVSNTGTAIYGTGTGVQVDNIGGITSSDDTGIFLSNGGGVSNGTAGAATANIAGYHYGVRIGGSGGSLTNFGTVTSADGVGVSIANGAVTNGTSTSTVANITGYLAGVVLYGTSGSVTNFATISANGFFGMGVYLTGTGGSVTNNGLIQSSGIAGIGGGGGTVVNTKTIEAVGLFSDGISLAGIGGVITNASGALVRGSSAGIYLGQGGWSIANTGLITGAIGVYATNDTGNVTITNFGTITGTGGTAVSFGSGSNLLAVEAGAVVNGVMEGGPGNDIFEFTAAGLTASDTIVGGGGTDTLVFTTAGAIASSAFTHVSGIGTIDLANGTNNVSLTNVASAPNATETVVGGTGNDTINATGVGSANTLILNGGAGNDVFEFTAAGLTSNDTIVGGGGSDTLLFTTAGTIAASAFTHVSGVGTIDLANGTNNVSLTNVAAAPNATETVVGGTGNDTINATGVGAANTLILNGGAGNDVFEFTAAGLTSNDTIVGGGGSDTLLFTTAGTIAASVFDHISGVGTIDLANGTNNLSLANVASAPDKSETVQGGTGNDTINAAGVGAGNTVTFNGGGGNDTITGSQGDNIYQFDNTPGTLGITNSFSSGTAAHGELDFGPGLSDQSIWFLQSGNNLVAEVIGTAEKVTINGWFGSNASAQLTEIKANGLELDSKVSNLVSAMATYQSENPSFNPTAPGTTMPTDSTQDGTTLQNAIAASWHS